MKYLTSSQAETRIGKSEFTVKWIVDELNANDDTWKKATANATLSKVDILVVGEGKGFVSTIYKISLHFGDNVYKYVLKVPATNKLQGFTGQEVQLKSVMKLHEVECFFLRTYREGKIPMARVYAMRDIVLDGHEGAILMEYAADHAGMSEHLEYFTKQQILSLIREVAHLQAYSLTLPEEELERHPYPEEGIEFFHQMKASNLESALKMDVAFPKLFEHVKHLGGYDFTRYVIGEVHKELGMRAVFVHGDLHGMNILWNENKDGSLSSELRAILDWQCLHAGNVGEDIARILVLGASPGLRRELEETVFDFFLEVLSEDLTARGMKNPFKKEQIVAAYERAFIGQTMMIFAMTGILEKMDIGLGKSPRVVDARKGMLVTQVRLLLEDAIIFLARGSDRWKEPNCK